MRQSQGLLNKYSWDSFIRSTKFVTAVALKQFVLIYEDFLTDFKLFKAATPNLQRTV